MYSFSCFILHCMSCVQFVFRIIILSAYYIVSLLSQLRPYLFIRDTPHRRNFISFSEVEFVTNFGEEIKCSAVLHAYTRTTGAGQSHWDSLIDAGQSRWDSVRMRQHLFLFKSGSHSTASFERRCCSLPPPTPAPPFCYLGFACLLLHLTHVSS